MLNSYFITLVFGIAITTDVSIAANASNVTDYNFTYSVSGDMTLKVPDNQTYSFEISHRIEYQNRTNDTSVTNFTAVLTTLTEDPLPTTTLTSAATFWYEVLATASDQGNQISLCAVPQGVSTCNWNTMLHDYGIPVKSITFRRQNWGNPGLFFNGVKLEFYDNSVQQFGDLGGGSGTSTSTLTFALGETISTLVVHWSQGVQWNTHCCSRCWDGSCCQTCWVNPWVFSYIQITTSKGQDFSAGNAGIGPNKVFTYSNVAGKLLSGLYIAPRENGNDGEAGIQISGIGFLMFDNIVTVEIEDVDYSGLSSYTNGLTPKGLLTWPVCNNEQGTITLTRTYSEETGSEACFSEEKTEMYGAEVTVSGGIPKIGVDVSGTAKWEVSTTQTQSLCTNDVATVSESITAEFEGNSETTVTITQFQSKISIPYTAKIYLNTQNNGDQEVMTINGQYTGVYVSSTTVNREAGATCTLEEDEESNGSVAFCGRHQLLLLIACLFIYTFVV